MRALQLVLAATFALAHGILMPWHLAAAHHTSAAHLLDFHLGVTTPAPEPTGPCDDDHGPHEESDHHHGSPDDAYTLQHAIDAVKVRPGPLVAHAITLAILPPELEAARPAPLVVRIRRAELPPPLGPPDFSPLRARGPPRV
jgi:hypothetical protein